jgi:hypothetical protein
MVKKVPIKSLSTVLTEQIHVFICSASFEKRSTVISTNLDRSRVDHAIICANRVTFTSLIDETASQLCEMFGERAKSAVFSMENPLVIADQLQRTLKDIPEYPATTYVVDVTSFTHEALLILLRVLQATVRPSDNVTGLYNAASEYSVGAAATDKWLTKGVGEIRSVLGYPGKIVPTQKVHLIVLVGYEMERAERIIGAYEPTILSLGYGSPLESISPPLHELNKKFHRTLSEKNKGVALEFMFSCENALEAKESVEKQAGSIPGYNVFVAPMNTKISTVGVGLAAFNNPAMQLCYATAGQYNVDAYSTPSDDCYVFEIPLFTTDVM